MKNTSKQNVIVALMTVTMSLLASTSAHATHAYRSETCRSGTVTLQYQGNYPIGGYYAMAKNKADIEHDGLITLPNDDQIYGQDEIDQAEVIFSEKASKVISKVKESSECYFDYSEWTSKKLISFDKVSSKAAAELGIVKGQAMIFVCSESTAYPNGNTCE